MDFSLSRRSTDETPVPLTWSKPHLSLSPQFDDKTGDDAAKGEQGHKNDRDFDPFFRVSSRLSDFPIDPFFPSPLGWGAGAMVMAQRPRETGFFTTDGQTFHFINDEAHTPTQNPLRSKVAICKYCRTSTRFAIDAHQAFQRGGAVLGLSVMGDSTDNEAPDDATSKPGCLGKLVVLILLMAGLGIVACFFFMAQAQDLSDLGDHHSADKSAPVRDLKVVLQYALDREYTVTLTETEINQWLERTLAAKQVGSLAGAVAFKRVYVRLEEGVAEVIMERRIMGKPFTTSMFVRIEQTQDLKGLDTRVHLEGGSYHSRMLIDPVINALPSDWRAAVHKHVPALADPHAFDASLPRPLMGGRFGKLVVPQGFLILVLPAFDKLPPLFHDEIELGLRRMARVTIEKGKLVMDPREPSDNSSDAPLPF